MKYINKDKSHKAKSNKFRRKKKTLKVMGKDTFGKFLKRKAKRKRTEGSIIDQGPRKPSLNKTPPAAMSSACLLSVAKLQSMKKFNQRREKMQKERKTVKQDKIIIV